MYLIAKCTHYWNLPLLWLFLTALMSWLILAYRMETSQPSFFLEKMNSSKVMYVIWLAHYSIWLLFLDKKALKAMMVTISYKWNFLENLLGHLYRPFLNQVRTNCTCLAKLSSRTMLLYILEKSRTIGGKTLTPRTY